MVRHDANHPLGRLLPSLFFVGRRYLDKMDKRERFSGHKPVPGGLSTSIRQF